ncbi:hypothetical protein P9G84_25495 [Brevibacillus centrosporus]|uniref:hypothetical protein n=1 Tax=Brevibacillus centrosporus TaxID=54910 RepID=UPI000F0A3B1A|nr:hypothetical protein [Brevibacillus centrosporus]MEC2132262.1 hypothetical protein [Brevibacillus centrosporus]RNB72397.1 hypothetical protein EDM55_06230 [Brevibacillus centrosporus]GED33842.1 hypothetical protein BCE02nite_49830 [Brevibacillus centrosporus]
MSKFVDWNRRVLEALEQTFPYDARLMTFFVQEGERQNQLYAERLAEFRKKVEAERQESERIIPLSKGLFY